MAKGNFPGFGNMGNIMKQAQKMQKDMEKVQDDLKNIIVEASSGGGAVTVKATAKKEIKEIIIKQEVVDPDDVEMLQDLILTAVNETIKKAEEVEHAEMAKVTGGMGGLPGMF